MLFADAALPTRIRTGEKLKAKVTVTPAPVALKLRRGTSGTGDVVNLDESKPVAAISGDTYTLTINARISMARR